MRNALVGFNLLVSIEWDATAEEIRRFTDRLREMSELLFNATDGQFLVERLTALRASLPVTGASRQACPLGPASCERQGLATLGVLRALRQSGLL